MTNPTVSIIIPVYNAERYIERCIDSIVAQSCSNWELIAVNDGSTDSSLLLLNKYATDKRVTIVDIQNGGVVNARRTGLEYAKGNYLAFVDADDYLPRGAIAMMVEKMRDKDVDLVIGSYTLHWESNNKHKDVSHEKSFSTPDECLNYCIRYGETFLPVKMYKTDLFRKFVDIPQDVTFMEDTIGVTQYLSHCKSVATINEPLYIYFKNRGSASMTIRPNTVKSMLFVAQYLLNFAIEKHCGDKSILIDKIGDLLFNVMGHLDLIPEDKEQFQRLLSDYSLKSHSGKKFRDSIMGLYLNSPRLAILCYSTIVRVSKIKSSFKKTIWKMIH